MEQLQSVPNPTTKRTQATALLVLGMHRSGTSALARVCNLLGAQLGENLLPPAPDNEAGFWEQREIHVIHDNLLQALGSTWDDHRRLADGWVKTSPAETARTQILNVLRRDFGGANLFVIKDPRMCRLVPLWVSVIHELGAEPRFLMIVRNPLEVAASLQKRDGFLPAKSIALWLRHMLDAERETRRHRRVILTYDSLLANWRESMNRVGRTLEIDWATQIDNQAGAIEAFLSTDLRHLAVDDEILTVDPLVSGWARDAYMAYRSLADHEGRAAHTAATLDRVDAELQRADQLFGVWLATQQQQQAARYQEQLQQAEQAFGVRLSTQAQEQTARHEGQLRELTVHGEQLQQEVAARQAIVEQLQQEVTARQATVEQLQREVATHRETVGARDAELAARDREVEQRNQVLAQRTQELTQRNQEIAQRDQELAQRNQEIRQRDQELERRNQVVAQHKQKLAQRDQELAEHKQEIAERDGELVRRDEEVEQRDRELAQRDRLIQAQREELAAARREQALRIAQMEQLTRQLSLKSEQVGELTRQVEAVSEESRRLREQVKELSSQMQRDNAEHAAREARQQELLEEFTDLVPPERLFRFVLDEPSSWHLNKPRVELRGWCFHRRGERLTGVRARINGCTVAGQHGLSRPDVARDYPRAAGATESGFVISLRAPLGKSRLAVEVLTERHGWVEVFSTTCRNPFLTGAIGRGLYLLRRRIQWHPRPSGVRRLNEDFEFTVDDPSRWKLRRRETLVRGWCFHRQGRKIVAVRARVNGKEWIGRVGLRRADVGGDHPGFPEANASGFEIQCVAPRGRFTMTMEVKMEGGGWEAFCEARGRAPWARIFEEPALTYRSWVAEYDTLRKKDVKLINRRLSHLSYQPLISVLMPLYNTPEPWLRRALESVCEQVYPHWELCIGNDASTAPHVRRVLDEFARRDARIRVVHRPRNGHIVAASNSALELVRGEFIALMDSDDELPRHALYMVAEELNAHPDADLIYSDEDKMDDKGVRYEPYFKSELNPDLFLSQNLVNHLGVYRTSLVRELGGFLQEALGSQDYDLALRVLERTTPERVRHIPHVLYHWRAISGSGALDLNDKPYAHQAARTAIRTHLQRRGVQVEVVAAGVGQYHRVIYPLPTPRPPVTVIMLSGGKPQYLAMGLTSVLRKTNYDNLRLLLMPNRVQQPESLQLIEDARRDPRVTVLPYDDPFNFSRMNNLGVGKCTSELVVFFNDDLDVINGDWLDELVRHGVRPEVAAVGPMLFYPDNTIQHAGVVVGINGVASHVHKCFGRGQHGYFGRAGLIQNFSALTAGCLLMRRSVFQEVGGFDEELPVAFNDVDLCLRIREKGYLLTWTPYAQLYHHESVTLGRHDSPARAEQFRKETNYLKQRWKHILGADPYYSPNLSLKSEDFGLAFPPRVGKPWQRSGRGADGVVAK